MSIRTQVFGGGSEHRLLKAKPSKAEAEFRNLTEVSIPREETRRVNSREEDRHRLVGAVFELIFGDRTYNVEVINLSGGGAMIAGSLQPNIGEHVHLQLAEDASIECAVRWVKAGRLGLEFAHETKLECSVEDRTELLRDVIDRDFPKQRPENPALRAIDPGRVRANQRSAMRHPLIWSGELNHGSHTWTVRLRNISSTGALIECPGALRVDSEITLELGQAGCVTGSVTWIVGDHMGLKFDEPFDVRKLSEKKPMITPATWVRPAYLEAHAKQETPWDPAWSRLSVDELRTELEGFLKR